jgi:hypothetical protein
VVGGKRRKRTEVTRETLLLQLLDNEVLDNFPASKYKKHGVSPARLFWLETSSLKLRVAPLAWRGDGQDSLRANSYTADGTRSFLELHSLLGWTFLCPPKLAPHRWGLEYEFDHLDENHGNNRLSNLKCKPKGEHRAESGALGAAAKRRRRG